VTSNALLMRPTGPLTEDTCHTLRQQLAAAFAAGVSSIAVDLSAVTDVDSAGLQVLAGAARHLKRRQGLLVVTKAPEHVLAALRVHELTELLDVPATTPLRVVTGEGEPYPSGRPHSPRLRVVHPNNAS
jgi:anti-anti-sigma factor